MRLKTVKGGRARKAQTPQEEMQLKGLGWTDMDIDKMSAKQVEIILRKKTKRRMKANSIVEADAVQNELVGVMQHVVKKILPQIQKMDLSDRKQAVQLYGALMGMLTTYSQGTGPNWDRKKQYFPGDPTPDQQKWIKSAPDARMATIIKMALKGHPEILKVFDEHKIDKKKWASVRSAANTPEQVAKMLEEKIKGAQALYDQLKKVDYGDYNIGDFFKSDLPKLRTLSDRIMKQKKDLETTLYSYLRQADKDLKEAKSNKGASARMAAFFKQEGVTGKVQGAHHQVGQDWYVDTEFINHSQHVYPGSTLRHMGMGEFVLETPEGDIEFDRMRGKDFPGQSGRSHKLYGAKPAVAKLLKLMEQKGKSKKAAVAKGKKAATRKAADNWKTMYIVDTKTGKAVAGPFNGGAEADKAFEKGKYNHKTHQVISKAALNPQSYAHLGK